MIKQLEKSFLLILAVITSGFIIFGYSTSILKITDFIIFCIYVLGFDLLYGHMGRLSFGHMLYFGAGAYGAALCGKFLSPNVFIVTLCGILLGAVIGGLLGPILIRTKGACFALLNLAYNQVGYFLVLVPLSKFTGGEDGISLHFTGFWFFDVGNIHQLFFLSLTSLILIAILTLKFTHSPYGLLLKGIKENETRVNFLGYSTYHYKLVTFILSAMIAAFAGALTTLNYNYANPSFIDPHRNVEVIFATLIGGAGNVMGAVIGGVTYMTISNYLPRYIVRWEMFLGMALLIIAFKFRKGIWGYIRDI